MLPKTSERVESQMLYYPCFSTFARHKQPPVSTDGNPGIEFDIILKTISAFPAARTVKKDSLAERNAEVASWWTTKPKSNNNSTSIFDENLGEDLRRGFQRHVSRSCKLHEPKSKTP
jgi:hypothetical protein